MAWLAGFGAVVVKIQFPATLSFHFVALDASVFVVYLSISPYVLYLRAVHQTHGQQAGTKVERVTRTDNNESVRTYVRTVNYRMLLTLPPAPHRVREDEMHCTNAHGLTQRQSLSSRHCLQETSLCLQNSHCSQRTQHER